MVVISVIGPPGVGKSTLVRQLACLNCAPAFFEGEEGIFTKKVLAVLNAENDSKKRYAWILNRYQKHLKAAHQISRSGGDAYVDGDILTFEAWLDAEIGSKSPPILRAWLGKHRHLRAHKLIILTATERNIHDRMRARGRASEQTPFIYARRKRVHNACLALARKYPHAIVIDRTGLDFYNEKDLQKIDGRIKRFKPKPHSL